MSNLREKIIIKNLIEEILNISATNLEIVGKKSYRILSINI